MITLNEEEIYYLAEYRGIEELFGIQYKEYTPIVMSALVSKDILSSKGKVHQNTVYYVETLKKYSESKEYFIIQEYLFGIQEDNLCVIFKYHEDIEEFSIYVGDLLELVRIGLQHPILAASAQKYYQEMVPDEEILEDNILNLIRTSVLHMQHFNALGNCINSISIGCKRRKYYQLDEELEFTDQEVDIDVFKWLLECLPKVKECCQKVLENSNE